MYNGIGLQTARGSGTNGYIQTNKFFIKPRTNTAAVPEPYDLDAAGSVGGVKKANKGILEHDRKRRIELRLLSLQEALEEQGYTEDEIVERVAEARKGLEEEARVKAKEGDGAAMPAPSKRFSDTQSHQIAARKQKQLELFRNALGIKQVVEPLIGDQHEENQQQETHSLENDRSDEEKAPEGKVSKDIIQNNETIDLMEEGEIRSSKKSTDEGFKLQKYNKDAEDESDSDSYPAKQNTRKRVDKSVKKLKRHDSDSDSGRNLRGNKKLVGKQPTKSRRYDSEDSKSDNYDERSSRRGVLDRHHKPPKSHKTIDSEIDSGMKNAIKDRRYEKSSRNHDSEDSLSDTDREKVNQVKIANKHNSSVRRHDSEGKLLEKLGKSSSRHMIESDTIHEKKQAHKKEGKVISAANESRGVRSDKLVNEPSKTYTKKKRLDDTDDESSESDGGRKNTVVGKQNNHKKKGSPVSSSSSSDYSSATNSSDSSQSDASSDYSREKYSMKKAGIDYPSRSDISRAKQEKVVSSRTDRTNAKDAKTARQSDVKIGRDYENKNGTTKAKQEQGFSSRSDKKNDTNVKNDHNDADNDQRSHLGHQHKTDRNSSVEPRRDHKDANGGGSREERKRKVEDAGLSDKGFRESRRAVTVEEQEGRERESRGHRSYGRSQEDRRREDNSKSYKHEDNYEKHGGTRDELRYDDTKRRRFDDSPQYSSRNRRDRNYEDDSGGGRRR